ncbi:MAG TPA: class I SAM-dependent methyltransferase [Conexibacter sp.]
MALHPLAAGFADVADAYERGRPEHAPAVVAALATELHLPPGAPVLDLAAGTGKLARPLLAAGFDVVAVEPQASLRAALARRIGPERVRDGLAEAIPLPDASVAAVTVADAFHWFDQPAALAEIRRVLRPRGGLALLRAVPDWSGASWVREVGELIVGVRPEHPAFDGPPWQDAVRAAGDWSEPRELRVTTAQPADAVQVVAYVASISWIAGLPPREREPLLARVGELVHAGETPAELPVHVTIGLATLV